MAHLNYNNGYYDGDVNYNNEAHGHGTYVWNDGDKYVGEWRDGKRTGHGTYVWNNGNKYVGDFVDGKQHGHGTFVWNNGDRYDGEWRDGKQHGHGTYVWNDGGRYVGEWRDGNMHGHGKKTSSNGAYYDGEWRDDEKYGRGKLVQADGTTYSGTFIGRGNDASSVVCITTKERLPLPGKIENNKFIPDGLPQKQEGEKATSKKAEFGQISYDLGAYSVTYFEGKKVYYKDGLFSFSKENRERMLEGNAPIGADGYSIELHHVTQMDDSPIVELLYTTHKGYSRTLHNPYQEYSGINRAAFNNWKKNYWINRVKEYLHQ